MKIIINGRIVKENEVLTGYAMVYDEVIVEIIPQASIDLQSYTEVIDAAGCFVAPGFINVHIHGCAGMDVMDEGDEPLKVMRDELVKTGVTAFLPTTMTYDFDKIHKALAKIRKAMQGGGGAKVLGANVEGPFIHKSYKGAHDEQYIVKPEFSLVQSYADAIKIMTVAPENIEDQLFMKQCQDHKIILSLGHSSASYEEAIEAISRGFSHITHMFNAMPVFNHRNPGVIGAAMDTDVICELITDDIHVHPAMQRILLRGKGLDQIVLVTDSMRACMLADGEYELGGQPVIVKDNTAKLKNGVIAGSVLTMDHAVRNFKNTTGLSMDEVLKLVTVNPAKELGVYDEIGSIEVGKKADIVIFNDEIEITATLLDGAVAYRRK